MVTPWTDKKKVHPVLLQVASNRLGEEPPLRRLEEVQKDEKKGVLTPTIHYVARAKKKQDQVENSSILQKKKAEGEGDKPQTGNQREVRTGSKGPLGVDKLTNKGQGEERT